MVLLRRLITIGSVSILSTCVTATCTGNEWNFGPRLSPNGLVRFGRAAVAVVTISYDYKRTLWGVDTNSPEYTKLKSKVHLRSAAKLRDLCCINGGVFIKAGQYIGSLDYLLPAEYVQTMKVLHSDAPQSLLRDIYHVIEEDLGQPVSEIFSDFEPSPLGAASLAQVHKAKLHDGRIVAVKVQHRDVQEHAAVDTRTIEFLVRAVAWIFPEFQFLWLVEETKKNLPLELDFLHEGKNAEKMAKLFESCSFLKIPKVYWELSSKRVLMMEFCDGGKVDDLHYMKENGISCDEVSRKIGELYSEMIFVHGYVHCDPHPGNVFVRKDNSGRQVEIVLLDHGLYQTLTDDFRINYCKMWQALISTDLEGIKRSSEDLGVGDMYGLLACMLTARSWDVVTSGINQENVSEEEKEEIRVNATRYLNLISELLNRVPRQLLLLFKTNDLLRSIDHTLDTSATARSFITMARCCVRAVTSLRLEQCRTWYCRLGVYANAAVSHIRISFYQLSVSRVGSSLLGVFVSMRYRFYIW